MASARDDAQGFAMIRRMPMLSSLLLLALLMAHELDALAQSEWRSCLASRCSTMASRVACSSHFTFRSSWR